MHEQLRNTVFISHANPEDNLFVAWLGARLEDVGFTVWADIHSLRGGHDWQRKIEHELRNKSVKSLVVCTQAGLSKQGVRNEIQIADEVGKQIGDDEFIIPLRLGKFDAPFLIAHRQYIDFQTNWSEGLQELIDVLENTYHVPRDSVSLNETAKRWTNVFGGGIPIDYDSTEDLISNWLTILNLPRSIYFHQYSDHHIDHSQSSDERMKCGWPFIDHGSGWLSCCSTGELSDEVGAPTAQRRSDEIATEVFIEDGWRRIGISRYDARRHVVNLARQSIESFLYKKNLSSYMLASKQLAWWYSTDVVSTNFINFRWSEKISGRRQINGKSEKRNVYWHFGVTPKPLLYPFPHLRIVSRVVFTDDGINPLDNAKRMHRLRRSFTKSWRNARWRDMLLAFLHHVSDGCNHWYVPSSPSTGFRYSLPPVVYEAPFSISIEDLEVNEDEASADTTEPEGSISEYDLDDDESADYYDEDY